MVGYNRIPTLAVSEPTLGFLAALAKQRGGSQQPRAISRPFPLAVPFCSSASRRSLSTPLASATLRYSLLVPKPHQANRAIKLPLSFVLSYPLRGAHPADSTAHTVRKPPRRFPSASFAASSSFPLRPLPSPLPSPSPGQGNAGSLQIQTTEHEVTTRQI